MDSDSSILVCVSRNFEKSAERVFDAWLDVEIARKFLFATETGEMVRAEIDPRVGGKFVFTDRRDGLDVEHRGEYLEIDCPRRLIFNFGVLQFTKDVSRVCVQIEPHGESCTLTLTQKLLPEWAEYADRTEAGWRGILDKLAMSLGVD